METALSVEVEGATLAGRTSGSGTPVLLVHGTAPAIWGDSVRRLARHGRVIVYDRRSFGGSLHAPLASLTVHAKDAIALLEIVAKEPAVIVGWSIGGVIALEVAALRPDLVRGLVLLEPPLHAKRHPTVAMVSGILKAKLFAALGNPGRGARSFYGWALSRRTGPNDLDRLPAAERDGLIAAAPAIVRELDAGTGEHITPTQLAQLACPVTVVAGDDSSLAFLAAAARIVTAVPGATLIRAERSGHCIQLDRPDLLETTVAEALRWKGRAEA
jgi:pimeloyl-ACP methyl ester carboxylesterase